MSQLLRRPTLRRRFVLITLTLTLLLLAAGSAAGASTTQQFLTPASTAAAARAADPGKLVARKSASGEMAAFIIEVKLKSPKAVYVRLGGNIGFGEVKMLCSRDVDGIPEMDRAARAYRYSRRGLFRVPIKPAHAQRCEMSLSVGGSGHASGEIRVVR